MFPMSLQILDLLCYNYILNITNCALPKSFTLSSSLQQKHVDCILSFETISNRWVLGLGIWKERVKKILGRSTKVTYVAVGGVFSRNIGERILGQEKAKRNFSIKLMIFIILVQSIIIYLMKRESQSQQQQPSSPGDSSRNSSSIPSKPMRVPIKNGTVIRNPNRVLSHLQAQREERAKKMLAEIQFEECGFGRRIGPEQEGSIRTVLEKIQHFGKNPDGDQTKWDHLWSQNKAVRANHDLIMMKRDINHFFCLQSQAREHFPQNAENSIRKLEKQEYDVWQGVNEIQEIMRIGDCFPGLSGIIDFKLNQFNQTFHRVRTRCHRSQSIQITPQISEINRQYTKLLVLKAFSGGIKDMDIDQLEYFKLREFQEGHCKGVYKPIETPSEWVQFVSKRRNKKRKADRFLLHTACQTCFSPHAQETNPIVTCPQCHLRNHFLCLNLKVVERCGRCIYSRLSKQTKQITPECFMCPKTELTPIRITYNSFAHGFCLLANNQWDIKDGKLAMSDSPAPKTQFKNCDMCYHPSNYTLKCSHCEKNYHPICAFLKGCSMRMKENGDLEIDCSVRKMRQGRAYILNYKQMVFKKLNELKKKGINLDNEILSFNMN